MLPPSPNFGQIKPWGLSPNFGRTVYISTYVVEKYYFAYFECLISK